MDYLFHDQLDIVQGNALIVAPDNEFEEIVSQDLENHAHVGAIDSVYLEIIQELDTALAIFVFLITLADL